MREDSVDADLFKTVAFLLLLLCLLREVFRHKSYKDYRSLFFIIY